MIEVRDLLARIDEAWTELNDCVGRLGADGLTITGADGWAVKDHLTHIGAWELLLLALLEGRERNDAMGIVEADDANTDAINDSFWKLHRHETPKQAVSYFKDAHAQLVAGLLRLKPGDLERAYSDYRPATLGQDGTDRPVMDWVAGNTYDHYAEHIAWIGELAAKRS
jgi:hypothetical protein